MPVIYSTTLEPIMEDDSEIFKAPSRTTDDGMYGMTGTGTMILFILLFSISNFIILCAFMLKRLCFPNSRPGVTLHRNF
ncbi:unnamed protein product [Cylicocyclus nassatus]|uniref:Uncharacterized protein n=1 Tax=Cylicocyclus nassatus TaxID=53992 RepID=A0AA36GNL8_CYLNA|nr:unnamed protein product [Cylicocyclus nassatus]